MHAPIHHASCFVRRGLLQARRAGRQGTCSTCLAWAAGSNRLVIIYAACNPTVSSAHITYIFIHELVPLDVSHR